MKHHVLPALAAVLVFGLSFAAFAAPKEKTYSGEIMDSQCAMNGSHAEMLKKEGMGDKDPNDPTVKAMCTKNCVKMGGKYILYDSASKRVYNISSMIRPNRSSSQVKT